MKWIPKRKAAAGAVLLALAMTSFATTLVGCGAKGTSASESSALPVAEEPTDTGPIEQDYEDVPSDFYESYEADVEAGDGTTAKAVVDVGRILPAGDSELPTEFSELAAACDAEPGRAGVIPVVLRVENTTEDFAGTFRFVERVLPRPSLGDEEVRRVAAQFSDSGPSCQDNNQVATKLSIEPGGSGRQVSAVVLENYFNPSSPDGDIESFNLTEFQLALNSGTSITNIELDGPNSVGDEILLLDAARH